MGAQWVRNGRAWYMDAGRHTCIQNTDTGTPSLYQWLGWMSKSIQRAQWSGSNAFCYSQIISLADTHYPLARGVRTHAIRTLGQQHIIRNSSGKRVISRGKHILGATYWMDELWHRIVRIKSCNLYAMYDGHSRLLRRPVLSMWLVDGWMRGFIVVLRAIWVHLV